MTVDPAEAKMMACRHCKTEPRHIAACMTSIRNSVRMPKQTQNFGKSIPQMMRGGEADITHACIPREQHKMQEKVCW